MFKLKKDKEKKEPSCLFCQKKLSEKNINEVKYEHLDGESVLGYICNSCADILDSLEQVQENVQPELDEDDIASEYDRFMKDFK